MDPRRFVERLREPQRERLCRRGCECSQYLSQMAQGWPWSCQGSQGSRQRARLQVGVHRPSQAPAAPHCKERFRVCVPTSTNTVLKTSTDPPFPAPSLSAGRINAAVLTTVTPLSRFFSDPGALSREASCVCCSQHLTGTQMVFGPP